MLLIIFNSSYLFSIVELGTPFITNYDTEKFNAHGQNWCALQDNRGVLFFGNSFGVLEFDGQKWRLHKTKENAAVRVLSSGEDGTIYFGAIGDFGYLKAEDDGKLSLVSLKDLIPEKERVFNDVWQIEHCPDGIYFLTRSKFFRLNKGKITALPGKLAFSQACVINGTIFYADIDRGICAVQGDTIIPIPQLSRIYDGKRIAFVPFDQQQILGCSAAGNIFLIDLTRFWDQEKKTFRFSEQISGDFIIKPFIVENYSFFKNFLDSLYKLISINRDSFAISTLRSGILIFNRRGQIERVVNKSCGLPGNTILGLQVDQNGNLWATTEYGVSLIELSVPQSFYDAAYGIEGRPMSVIYWNNRLYVGTVQGLFVKSLGNYHPENNLPRFERLNGSPIQVIHFLDDIDSLLFVSADGVYQLKNEEIVKIPGSANLTYYWLARSNRWPDYIFAGMQGGVDVFKKNSGKWAFVSKVKGIDSNIRHICQDGDGNLWLGTDGQGLILMRFNGSNPLDVELQNLGLENGLPSLYGVRTSYFQNKIYALTTQGVYCTESWKSDEKIRFSPDSFFGNFFNDPPTRIFCMVEDGKGGVFFSTSRGVFWFVADSKGNLKLINGPFEGLPLPDWTIYLAPDDTVWIPQKMLMRIAPWAKKDYGQAFPVLIREVKTRGAGLIFSGTYAQVGSAFKSAKTVFVNSSSANSVLELPYQQNALSFEFSASFYEKPGTTTFQYFLEGFDQQWSEFKSVNYCEYTNLPEGFYRFRVRAKNLYGKAGQEAIFSLRILPPWYRTWWAMALWIAGGVLFVVGIVHLYTLRLRIQKRHLEALVAERTRQLHEASLTDPLTGLRNRRFITEVLHDDISAFIDLKKYQLKLKEQRQTVQEDVVFGVFLFDIDYFKKVNDTYGHEAGDRILKQFATILKSHVRQDDALMRIGGEEFLVVLKKTKPDYLDVFVKKILTRVAETEFEIGQGKKIHKTCSVGYISFPFYPEVPDLISFEQSVMIADLGLYYAKENGRNQGVHIKHGQRIPGANDTLQETLTVLDLAIKAQYLKIEKIVTIQ